MYNQTNNRRCVKGRYNQYQQCSNLVNKVIPSCSNVYGMDGWPASTPQQSNVGYTNGISGFSPPNGFKQYLQPMYLYKYNTVSQLFSPHHPIPFNSAIMNLKSGKILYTIDTKSYALVEDLVGSQLRLLNVFGIYRQGTNRLT
jgi:hypothetical protein